MVGYCDQHLNMLGVVLKSTFTQTRKINCDDMLEKFGKIMGSWRGGKFMLLIQSMHMLCLRFGTGVTAWNSKLATF